MYKDPYNNRINMRVKQDIEKLNKEIKEKTEKGSDKRSLMKLYEERALQGGSLGMFDGVYGKYQSPW